MIRLYMITFLPTNMIKIENTISENRMFIPTECRMLYNIFIQNNHNVTASLLCESC